jgi:hypothetical protein
MSGSWYCISVTNKRVKISVESSSGGKVHGDAEKTGMPIVVGGNRLMICPWSTVSVKYNKVTTMRNFYELMARTKFVRKNIVQSYFHPHSESSSITYQVEVLKHALQILCSVPTTESGLAQLALDTKKRMNLDLHYETTELRKDICFLEEGVQALLQQFMFLNIPKFENYVNEGVAFLGSNGAFFHNLITDRDGTINNYCGRYKSSIQSAYNSIFLTHFVMECCRNAIILTAAPLQAMIEISVNPDNTFVYAASKGREFLNIDMIYHTAEMETEQKLLMKRFNSRLKLLFNQSIYEKLTMIGSGLQFKFGQTTISRQDVSGSISPAESMDFLETIRAIVNEIAPNGELHLHDTGLDIEVSPTATESSRVTDEATFHKGNGLEFLNKRLSLDVDKGPNLVCGDTSSDLPMVNAAMTMCPERTSCIFVTTDPQLIGRVRLICPRTFIVPSPDVLVTILYETAVLCFQKKGIAIRSTLNLNDIHHYTI